MQMQTISGFSKLNKPGKLAWLDQYKSNELSQKLKQFWYAEGHLQKILDELSENTVSNFPIPYGLAPNFLINQKLYCVPMVIEESSVVAAASSAAKFWLTRGGFKAHVINEEKIGHVHFYWHADHALLEHLFLKVQGKLIEETAMHTHNMRLRGGGITSLQLVNLGHKEQGYFTLEAKFVTCDAMGANFINTVLETLASSWQKSIQEDVNTAPHAHKLEIIMSILSNYTPDCLVEVEVSCPVEQMGEEGQTAVEARAFSDKLVKAVTIARLHTHRAVTHNKGIFNGVDAVVLATGNDFRAVEACGHAYASRHGQYQSLSEAFIEKNVFHMRLRLPLALGTVGGLTTLHPLARASLEILDHPSAKDLMMIVAAVGLAQNFAAIRSLVTTGIQKGHMKMHLLNILNSMQATAEEEAWVKEHFKNKVISYREVVEFLLKLRQTGPMQ